MLKVRSLSSMTLLVSTVWTERRERVLVEPLLSPPLVRVGRVESSRRCPPRSLALSPPLACARARRLHLGRKMKERNAKLRRGKRGRG
jgi:hypothetical protein